MFFRLGAPRFARQTWSGHASHLGPLTSHLELSSGGNSHVNRRSGDDEAEHYAVAEPADGAVLDGELRRLEIELQKKLRIAQLRDEIAKLEITVTACAPAVGAPAAGAPAVQPVPAAVPAPPVRASSDEADHAVTPFTADDGHSVTAFIAEFEEASQFFGWPDQTKNALAKRLVRGTAKSFLRTAGVNVWVDIRRELEAEFSSLMSAAERHKALAARRRKVGETIQQYAIAMRKLAMGGNIEERDLVSYIVDGIVRDKNDRLFFASATTYAELHILLKRYQDANIDAIPTMNNSWRNNRTLIQAARVCVCLC